MKQKGFTLIELLAVVTLLGVFALLITPTIFKSINNFNKESYNSQVSEIEMAARNWLNDYLKQAEIYEANVIYVTIGQLKQDGYLSKNLTNPNKEMNKSRNEQEWFHNDSLVSLTKKGNRYVAKYITYSGNGSVSVNSDLTTNAPRIELIGEPIENLVRGASYSETTKRVAAYDGSNNIITSSITMKYYKNGVSINSIQNVDVGTYTVVYTVTANGITQSIARNLVVASEGSLISATCSKPSYTFNGCSATIKANTSVSSNSLTISANFQANTTYRVDIILEEISYFAYIDTHKIYDTINKKNLSPSGFVFSGNNTYSNIFTTDQATTTVSVGNGTYIGTDMQPTPTHAFDVKVYKLN